MPVPSRSSAGCKTPFRRTRRAAGYFGSANPPSPAEELLLRLADLLGLPARLRLADEFSDELGPLGGLDGVPVSDLQHVGRDALLLQILAPLRRVRHDSVTAQPQRADDAGELHV